MSSSWLIPKSTLDQVDRVLATQTPPLFLQADTFDELKAHEVLKRHSLVALGSVFL